MTGHKMTDGDVAAVGGPQESDLLDVADAARHLGVTEPFVRRLVLERRVRYYKLGKFVRFRAPDLDAFVEAGRRDPVQPWVHGRSTLQRSTTRTQALSGRRQPPSPPAPGQKNSRRRS